MPDKGEKTRKRIVSQALELFSVKGYYHTSIGDLMEATGLTKGALYGHFGSKEGLWNAAYEEAVGIWKSIVLRGIEPNQPPLEKLRRLIENDMRFYLGKNVFPGGCFFLNMLVELAGQSEPMKARVQQGIEGMARLIGSLLTQAEKEGALRPGVNYEEVAHYVVISLNGAAALYAGTRNPAVVDRTVRQLGVYLKGFEANPAGKDEKHGQSSV